MELRVDEQRLLADFRRLGGEGKKELLDFSAFLVKKYADRPAEDEATPEGQCRLEKRPEERPEAAKEPLFTE